MQQDISNFEATQLLSILQQLRIISENKIDAAIEQWLITNLKRFTTDQIFVHLTAEKSFPQIKRLTINEKVREDRRNDRLIELSQIKYHPFPEKISWYGRANMKKQSVLYAGFDTTTILNEIKPKVGQLFTVSTWRCSDTEKLTLSPIFKNWMRPDNIVNAFYLSTVNNYNRLIKQLPKNIAQVSDELIQFIADAFIKRVEETDEYGYFFSAYFGSFMLNDFETNDGKPIDAIVYPSVAEDGEFSNVAIKPQVFDRVYPQPYEVEEFLVESTPTIDSPGYSAIRCGRTNNFDIEKGKILW